VNLQFKRVHSATFAKYPVTDLRTAISEQLSALGVIVFSLVGTISDAQPAEVDITEVDELDALRFDPLIPETASIDDGVISISTLVDLDSVWTAVRVASEAASFDESKLSALSNCFERKFQELQEESACLVDLADVSDGCPSILSQIITRLESQVAAFGDALAHHRATPDDQDQYNELLRISYNFADGARAFLALLVGVCDLKPILFWMTIAEQLELAHRFAQLPFSLVGVQKPSLDLYRSLIADARNQAFHDIFAFDHPFRVALPGDALRGPELHLFRAFSKRTDSALTFEDRDLVQLFQSLTRTPSRQVPSGFWEGNELVMTGVVEVVTALRRALVVVYA
jgi:hypothetical protein